jgi:hypothetical protein
MQTLIIYPTRNQIKSDATGEFIPEAQGFMSRRRSFGDSVDSFPFDPHNFTKKDTGKLYGAIELKPYQCVAIFSHGVATSLPQLHIDRSRCADFARSLTCRLAPGETVIVILYACLTACPINSLNFAETLAKELLATRHPFRLWAHRTKGRCDENPNVTLHTDNGVTNYPNAIKDTKLRAKWRARVMKENDPYSYDYPFEMPEAINP